MKALEILRKAIINLSKKLLKVFMINLPFIKDAKTKTNHILRFIRDAKANANHILRFISNAKANAKFYVCFCACFCI